MTTTKERADLVFPKQFLFGAATAAYQIEGAVHEDGRGESVWDRFCGIPGATRNGESGATACDHYHRFRDDVGLMRDLGLDAYRFSIAWPRIFPDGRGRVNEQGLDFYDRLVDELLANNIRPFATLFHWDLPQVLEDRGGWLNRETCEAYVEYVEAVTRRLGDRVRDWITHNEPEVVAWIAYARGVHAPGHTLGTQGALQVAHHLLLSHGMALPVIRSRVPTARVGITLNLIPMYPASGSDIDMHAADIADGRQNRWFLDPIFRGSYPADMVDFFEQLMPYVQDGDLATISSTIDFLGINNYSRQIVRAGPDGSFPAYLRAENAQFTDMDWEVYPEGLYDLLRRVHRDYSPGHLYITENGASFRDIRTHDGMVRDPERQSYIADHLESVHRAIKAGVPVDGYFCWSLLDNFEWAHGYWMRFGLIYIDYPTQERVPKDSYRWYRSFITSQRHAEHDPTI
ncbi:MAG: GH1 family beta-glucosidase [Chloroflexota bacterium]